MPHTLGSKSFARLHNEMVINLHLRRSFNYVYHIYTVLYLYIKHINLFPKEPQLGRSITRAELFQASHMTPDG